MEYHIFKNEEELEKTVIKWLTEHDWFVHQQVKRLDTKDWEHPFTADLIIENDYYAPKLGAIGIELKINKHTKTTADAIKQIVSKYQGHKFIGIEKPVYCWAIITDEQTEWQQQEIFFRRTATAFGIALLNWKEITHPNYYNGVKSKYQRLKIAENDELSIHIDPEGFHATNLDKLQKWLFEKTRWLKNQNLNNIGIFNPPNNKPKDSKPKELFEYV